MHGTKCRTIAWPYLFCFLCRILRLCFLCRILRLCCGFSVSNPCNGAKYIFGEFVYQYCLCPRCFWKIHRQGMVQSIWNFCRLGWSVWTKFPGCLQLKNKNSPSTPIYCSMFRLHAVAPEKERERGGDR